jgi:CBS domain-containing protein
MLWLKDIMSTDLLKLTPETSIREAMELLVRRHVSGAPVMDGDRVVGIVTETDLMAFLSAMPGVPTERDSADDVWDGPLIVHDVEVEAEPPSVFFADLWDDAGADVTTRLTSVDGPEWNILEEHDVSEAMTRAPIVALSSDAGIEEAARLMGEKGIHRVLVAEGDTIVGIVSTTDLAKVVASGAWNLARRTPT